MAMFDVSVGGAILAGLLSFLSPCVLPLVLPYLCYVAGVSLDEFSHQQQNDKQIRRKILISAFAFVLGFSTVFLLLGATASLIGNFVTQYSDLFTKIAGVLIIILGVHFVGLFKIGFLYREARFQPDTDKLKKKGLGVIGAYFVGLAFAFGWTPCVGPVLAAILFMAGSEDSIQEGMKLLLAYSLGLGIPFILSAYFASQFIGFMQKFRRHLGKVEKVIGVLLILTGLLFVSGSMSSIAFWLLEAFPSLGVIG